MPPSVKTFTMWQQEMMLCDYLVVTGKDTKVSKDTIMGHDEGAYYINAKAIVAQKGSKVLKYASKFKRPQIEKLDVNDEDDVMLLEDNGHYTESNVGMKKVKVISINPPSRVSVTRSRNKLSWSQGKNTSEYWIYYAEKKGGPYKKIATTKTGKYIAKKSGYYRVKGIKEAYGFPWKGKNSRIIRVS